MVVLIAIDNVCLCWNVEIGACEVVFIQISVEEINLVASKNKALRTHDGDTREMDLDAVEILFPARKLSDDATNGRISTW